MTSHVNLRLLSCTAVVALGLVAGAGSVRAQAVVPSGTTATTATTAGSGQITVNIAPVTGNGVSLNQYNAFSVPTPGVNLNNRTVNANTIVNEVTGSSRTTINGALEVLGSRAHVLVVNPNGVTVDGGRFVNVGGVGLAAGSVRMVGGNPVVTTGTGSIEVTGEGLSGTMTSLQLMAGRLRIDGPVLNDSASPNADIALVAGNHEITLDSTLQANSTLRPWASKRDLGGSSTDILVDVTPRGSLTASKVQIAVSARGAGVSFAGNGQATIGEFTINAAGKVTFAGGEVRAERSVKVVAPSIEVLNAPARQSSLQSLTGAVTLLANAGDIILNGSITGANRDGADPDSRGAVTLNATGNISLLSESADRLAIAFASNGDLSVTAGGTLTNNTGRLLSNANTTIQTAAVSNVVDVISAEANGDARIEHVRGRRFWQSLWFKRKRTTIIHQNFGQLRLSDQLAYIVGRAVLINTGDFVNSGEVDAQDGALLINAANIANTGVRLGTVDFHKRCGLVCRSWGGTTVTTAGGAINAAQGMQLTATGRILNDGGQFVAYGNMELNAPEIVANAAFVPTIVTRPGGLGTFFAGTRGWAAFMPVGGQFISPTGTVDVVTSMPVTLRGGEIIAGAGVLNPSGVDQVLPPQPISPVGEQHIGLFRSWFE